MGRLLFASRVLPALPRLALAVAALACALHASGWLPPESTRRWLWLIAALPGLLAWRVPRIRRAAPMTAGLFACAIAMHQLGGTIDAALASRLDPTLEGLLIEADVLIDEMPDRKDFGDRVLAAVQGCRVIESPSRSIETGTDDSGTDRNGVDEVERTGSGCANLKRLQLDWSPERQRDRSDPMRRDAWPEPGDRWRVRLRARRPAAAINPGQFDLELRMLQQGIGATGRVTSRQRTDLRDSTDSVLPVANAAGASSSARDAKPLPLALQIDLHFEALRARLRGALESRALIDGRLGERRWSEVAILSALALGDQKAIDSKLWGLFARTGVSHLMAISGMHVTMLALAVSGLVGWLMGRLARRRASFVGRLTRGMPRQRIVLVLAVMLAFFYARLSGWGVPSQRTCWMLACAAALTISCRHGGPLAITTIASLPVLLFDPWAVGSAGFWLSFVAVAALVWQGQGANGHDRKWWRELLAAQWTSSIALLPLTAALFSMASLVGPLVNLIAIPWVSLLVTPAALLLFATAPIVESVPLLDWPWQRVLDLATGAVRWMLEALLWVDRLPSASVALPTPGWAVTLLTVCAAALLLAPAGPGLRILAAFAFVPLAFGAHDAPAPGELRITALDIGQGSAILVQTSDATVLYDTGAGQGLERNTAKRGLLPWFARAGITRLDAVIVSHLDAQHAGGAATLVEAMRPGILLSPFDARMLMSETLTGQTELATCVRGAQFSFGSMTIDALGPSSPPRGRKEAADNAASCVLRIAAPGGSVLLAGDLLARAERALIAANEAHATASTVLVVPAQGSRLAAGSALIDAVRPSEAIIQLPRRNSHGHPHRNVLERLEAAGTRVHRTDRDGALRLDLRADAQPVVHRARRDAPPYWRILDQED